MPRLWIVSLCLVAGPLAGQGSPYVPLDDPRLPVFEFLVARGDIRDPSPMVRPFRRVDALATLLAADTLGAPHRRLLQELRAAWVQDTSETQWAVEGRLGFDAYTSGRRDPLAAAGPADALPQAELLGVLRTGPVVVVSRSAVEPRLDDDPDWPGRTDLVVVGRMPDAYVSGQWRFARVFFGTVDRHWGPVGIAGIPLSAYGYPRTELAIDLGTDRVRLSAHAAQLTDGLDTAGARVHRYWFAHRLAISPSRRLAISLWETTVISGAGREFEGRWRNPAAILLLSNQYGLGADGNITVGADITWWPTPRLRLEGQLAVDDVNYPDPGGTDQTPSRYAFTLAATRPVGGLATAKLLYSQVSSLAFRTYSPFESYTDAGVGLGRGIVDADQLSLLVARPLTSSWLVSPELTLLRRGEGRLTDPFPAAEASAGDIPTLFIGTRETTWRAAVGVSGAHGALRAVANIGVHYVQDADHVAGRDRTTVEARIRLAFGLATGGRLQ